MEVDPDMMRVRADAAPTVAVGGAAGMEAVAVAETVGVAVVVEIDASRGPRLDDKDIETRVAQK